MKVEADVKLKKSFIERQKKIQSIGQQVLDKECTSHMKPYVPISPKKFKNSGNLLKSMTNPKPGKIVFTSQISRTQYYGYFKHNWSENPNAKRLWFEYMKKLYSRQIRKVVKERVHKIK